MTSLGGVETDMRSIHIVAGLIGISSGAVALIALKGASLHRLSGTIFVYSMLVMSAAGALLAFAHQPGGPGNVVAGTLTFYLVVTALLTVRRPSQARPLDVAAMIMGATIGVSSIAHGVFQADDLTKPGGYPAPFYFVLGAIALLLTRQDYKMFVSGGPLGTLRLTRHLRRMTGAMLIATGSFFVGQPGVFAGSPLEPIGFRIIPVLLVIAAMVYWGVRMARRPMITVPGRAVPR
jgi:hypothetical protein